MKLVVEEPESRPLRALLAQTSRQVTSAVVDVEVPRAVRRAAPDLAAAAARVVAQVDVVELDEAVRARAASLAPASLRSLDAIHLATALEAREELEGFLTYDVRLGAVAAEHGLEVLTPR